MVDGSGKNKDSIEKEMFSTLMEGVSSVSILLTVGTFFSMEKLFPRPYEHDKLFCCCCCCLIKFKRGC